MLFFIFIFKWFLYLMWLNTVSHVCILGSVPENTLTYSIPVCNLKKIPRIDKYAWLARCFLIESLLHTQNPTAVSDSKLVAPFFLRLPFRDKAPGSRSRWCISPLVPKRNPLGNWDDLSSLDFCLHLHEYFMYL